MSIKVTNMRESLMGFDPFQKREYVPLDMVEDAIDSWFNWTY